MKVETRVVVILLLGLGEFIIDAFMYLSFGGEIVV